MRHSRTSASLIWRILAIAAILALAGLQVLSLQHLQEMEFDETARRTLEYTYTSRNWHWKHQTLIEFHKGHLAGTGLLLIMVVLVSLKPDQREFRDAMAVTGVAVLVSALCWSVWAVRRMGSEGVDLDLAPHRALGVVGLFGGFICPTIGIILATKSRRKRRISLGNHILLCLIAAAVTGWTLWFLSLAGIQQWRAG